jgi:hypothetical protein
VKIEEISEFFLSKNPDKFAERGIERHDLELSLVFVASGSSKRFPFHNDECGKVVRNQSFLHWTVEPRNFCDCEFDFSFLKIQ